MVLPSPAFVEALKGTYSTQQTSKQSKSIEGAEGGDCNQAMLRILFQQTPCHQRCRKLRKIKTEGNTHTHTRLLGPLFYRLMGKT
jgi:hypothetical protein